MIYTHVFPTVYSSIFPSFFKNAAYSLDKFNFIGTFIGFHQPVDFSLFFNDYYN